MGGCTRYPRRCVTLDLPLPRLYLPPAARTDGRHCSALVTWELMEPTNPARERERERERENVNKAGAKQIIIITIIII